MIMKLKQTPENVQPFSGRSDVLVKTDVPEKYKARDWYMAHPEDVLPPFITSSDFVPPTMIEHIMRNKKDAALGVKWRSERSPPDAITNMEGALHTFVTPLVLAYLHGDYIYEYGHGVTKFDCIGERQQARTVIVSAQIQPDFEGPHVLLELCALKEEDLTGKALSGNLSIPSVIDKQSEAKRTAYDFSLKRHIVAHLLKGEEPRLPSLQEAASQIIELPQAIVFLESFVYAANADFGGLCGVFVRVPKGSVVALELLFQTALHQLRNELSALETLCPQGYVYTSDPPAIFAREIGQIILNRLQFAALKRLAIENEFRNMKALGFNDYLDQGALSLITQALLTQPHIKVMSKRLLFKGPRNTYSPFEGMEGALLVVHNNSDAFGQNIETEMDGGSMDGAIGANSSAAASLMRTRPDLVAHLM